MSKITAYRHPSRLGPVWLLLKGDGRWHVVIGDEDLGSYANAHQALSDVEGGHTYWPSCDTSTLGLSDNLNDWQALSLAVK